MKRAERVESSALGVRGRIYFSGCEKAGELLKLSGRLLICKSGNDAKLLRRWGQRMINKWKALYNSIWHLAQ